jgi:Electron transfer DM13
LPDRTGVTRNRVIAALVVATALGVGLLVLQRWVAETKTSAILLVGVWFALVGVATLVAVRARPELRLAALGTYAAIALASAVVGYWTGFRDDEVDEDVVVATMAARGEERDQALAGEMADKAKSDREPSGPVELARGDFAGADGHTGSGVATVVREPHGARTLTFTEFDVDPGPKVEVWLTRDESSLDDRVELGGLKGNVGNQQYDIPADANLADYDTVVLYCTPFTVRIAVAPLR